MSTPDFQVVESGGITYTCGCPCEPTASPAADGAPGHEHCCCGKVHFVGEGAASAMKAYLAERKAKRRREPDYTIGETRVATASGAIEVAWAFPIEN